MTCLKSIPHDNRVSRMASASTLVFRAVSYLFLFIVLYCNTCAAADESKWEKSSVSKQLVQIKEAQTVLNEFLNFLESSKNAAAPSSKNADRVTSIFLNKTTDTKVLADIALAAQYKLCIYWSMPPSNRTYWKSLYKNCRKKLGNNQTEEESYLLASLDCNCGHQPVFTDADSNQVLRKQLIASHVMDKFLIHLDSIRRKPNEIEAELVLKTNPILSNLSDYNVLTDIAVTANYRNRLYSWVVTPEKRLHRALFWSSVNQIALKSDWKASAALASIMHLTHAQSSTLLRLTEIQASQRNLRSQKEHH